jgi:EAL domain-containing protein (putative c-di-GMP-specific phosphodiesterase class I)
MAGPAHPLESSQPLGGVDSARAEIASLLGDPPLLRSVFQPVVALATGHVAGYEALTRFPSLGDRSPASVFEQARRCDMAPELESEAIRTALRVADRRPRGTWLSLNVSPLALTSAAVERALPGDLHDIVVEITEQELVTDDETFETALGELRARGARIAVDDAGSAYSGLQHIVRVQPDIIKLDRALVAGVRSRADKAALIDCFVGFAQRTGALVCAEGIESLDDLAVLADLDVSYGQGFALARPSPPWSTVAPAVAAELLRWSMEGRASDVAPFDLAASADRRLERLVERLSAVASLADLEGVTELIAQELHADEVLVSRWMHGRAEVQSLGNGGAPTGERFSLSEFPLTRKVLETRLATQVLAGDPTGDPAEIALLERLGYRSMLMVPVIGRGASVGILEVYAREERPWSRTDVNRARIISYPLGAALEALLDARNSSSTALNAAGRSSISTWPVSGKTIFRDRGIARS